jgi:Asp-tRNA(Asn)/Glu-tRNA(Gln) amidotransferase A subunit family amidase
LVYFSRTADHVGLFTQDVTGMRLAAALLLADWRPSVDGLPRPVLGVPEGAFLAQAEATALAAFEEQVARLMAAGYTVKRIPLMSEIADLNLLHRRMVAAEFAQEQQAIYPRYADRYRPRTREIIETGQGVSAEELTAARAHCLQFRTRLHERMDEHGIDLWISPSALGAAPVGIHATGDPVMNLPWTHAGVPALTLPVGWSANRLPLGLQLVARFGADEELLAWSQALAASALRAGL